MDAATEAEDFPDDAVAGAPPLTATTVAPRHPGTDPRPTPPQARGRSRPTFSLSGDLRRELMWITAVYLAARVLLVLVAVVFDLVGHHNLQGELANWDGEWYRSIANNGYPRHVSHSQTNLGFFPLYPITIYLLEPVLRLLFGAGPIWSATFAGVFISAVGGLIATIFVHRLAEGWWDRATARRATLLFVFFPGAVVFSMVYSEGLLLPLAAVCIWALERRRWMLAGVMAGLGTAVQPVGLLFGVVVGVCALRELLRHGLRSREFAMSLLATVMSSVGAVSFLAFEWVWTGNPFATFIAQSHGWHEKTDALALVHQVTRVSGSFDPNHFNHPSIDLNRVVGTVGAVLAFWLLWLLWRSRHELTLPAIVWTLGITYFMMTSENVPPNPRLLITAFPSLILLARWCRPRRFPILLAVNVILLVGLSLLTFDHRILRP